MESKRVVVLVDDCLSPSNVHKVRQITEYANIVLRDQIRVLHKNGILVSDGFSDTDSIYIDSFSAGTAVGKSMYNYNLSYGLFGDNFYNIKEWEPLAYKKYYHSWKPEKFYTKDEVGKPSNLLMGLVNRL